MWSSHKHDTNTSVFWGLFCFDISLGFTLRKGKQPWQCMELHKKKKSCVKHIESWLQITQREKMSITFRFFVISCLIYCPVLCVMYPNYKNMFFSYVSNSRTDASTWNSLQCSFSGSGNFISYCNFKINFITKHFCWTHTLGLIQISNRFFFFISLFQKKKEKRFKAVMNKKYCDVLSKSTNVHIFSSVFLLPTFLTNFFPMLHFYAPWKH